MQKSKDKDIPKIESSSISRQFRVAYENTLKESASHSCNPVTFQCGDDSTNPNDYLDCDSCPFYSRNDCNHDHNFTEWQEIWCRATGEKDERTPENILNSVPLTTTITLWDSPVNIR